MDAEKLAECGRLTIDAPRGAGPELPAGESASYSIGINTAGGEVARTEVRPYARPVER